MGVTDTSHVLNALFLLYILQIANTNNILFIV